MNAFLLIVCASVFLFHANAQQCMNRVCRKNGCTNREFSSGKCAAQGETECCDRQCDKSAPTITCGTDAGCFQHSVSEIATPVGKRLPNCMRDVVDTTTPCTNGCANCVLSLWSDWSRCSASCGSGLETRARSVSVPLVGRGKCAAVLSDSRGCDFGPCPTPPGLPTAPGPSVSAPADTITLPGVASILVAAAPLVPLIVSLGGTQSFQLPKELGSLLADVAASAVVPLDTAPLLTATSRTGALGAGIATSAPGEIQSPYVLRVALAQRRRVLRLLLADFDATVDNVSLVGSDLLLRTSNIAITQADTNISFVGGFPTWELVVHSGSVGFLSLELLDAIIPEPPPTTASFTEAPSSTLLIVVEDDDTIEPVDATPSPPPVSVLIIALSTAAGIILLFAIVSVLIFLWRKHQAESGPDLHVGPNTLSRANHLSNFSPLMSSAVMDPLPDLHAGAVVYDANFDGERLMYNNVPAIEDPIIYDGGITAPLPPGRTTQYNNVF